MEKPQQHREEHAVCGVVDVLRVRRLLVSQPQVGEQRRQKDEERDDGGDARLLQLAHVALIKMLQLVVLEPMRVQEATEGARRIHRLHAVVHGDGDGEDDDGGAFRRVVCVDEPSLKQERFSL